MEKRQNFNSELLIKLGNKICTYLMSFLKKILENLNFCKKSYEKMYERIKIISLIYFFFSKDFFRLNLLVEKYLYTCSR